MRVVGLLVVAASVSASCAAGDSDASSPSTPVAPPVTTPVPTADVIDRPTPSAPVSIPADEAAATPTERLDATATSTPDEPGVTAPLGEPADPLDDDPLVGFDDDPVFEIEPPQEFDLDLARFPVDDAGLGGTGADAGGSAASPTEAPPTGWAAFDRSLADSLIRPGNTAASVAVMIDGDVVHTAAFGSRTIDGRDPAEPQDRFRIASISKVITAVVLLQLVEDGVVGLDEPIGRVVADHLGVGITGGTAGLTVRRLLTHTSGYGTYQSTFFRGAADDCIDAARAGLRSGAGGGGYTYSNMNYCVAGQLIEALTGLDYEEAAYRYLLTPLGLSGLRLAPTFDPGPDEIQHVTTPGRNYMETLGGAGSWIASPTDLVTILDALDHSTSGWKPLEPATVTEMFTPFGAAFGQRGYGLGIIAYGFGRYGHTGTIESTHAMALLRGDGVTWAVTVAGQSPSESTNLESIVNRAFAAGGFIPG